MRKSDSHAFVNQVLIYALVAICSSGSLGLATVWMRHQISVAANENKVLQTKISEIERRLEETAAEVAAEEDPAVLNRRNSEWHLGLAMPMEVQASRVTEDPVQRLESAHNRALFGEGRATVNFRIAMAR